MTISDREILKNAWKDQIGSTTAVDPNLAVNEANRRTYTALVTDGGTVDQDVTATVIVRLARKSLVKSVYVTAPVAVSADNSNYATFTVQQKLGTASPATVASGDTRAASLNALAALVPEALSLTVANLVCEAGTVLTVAVAKTGDKAIAAATSSLNVSVDVEEI